MAELTRQLVRRLRPTLLRSATELWYKRKSLDVLLSFEPGWSAPKISSAYGLPYAIRCSDPHNKVDWLESYVARTQVSVILSPYPESMAHHFPRLAERVIDFPWSVPENWIHSGDILVHGTGIAIQGASGHPLYALRDWCRRFDFIRDHRVGGSFNLAHREHEYFRWMSRQDAFVVATSEQHPWSLHAVAKFVEVPAAGCLLIAQDSPRVRALGFDESNAVLFRRDDFEAQCRRVLEAPSAYLEHRRRGRDLVRARFTTEHRVDQLKELANALARA